MFDILKAMMAKNDKQKLAMQDSRTKNAENEISDKIKVDIDKLTDESILDELIFDAVEVILTTRQASVSMLQRRLSLGYARAAKLMNEIELLGIVGKFDGSKPREIRVSESSWKKDYFDKEGNFTVSREIYDKLRNKLDEEKKRFTKEQSDKYKHIEASKISGMNTDIFQRIDSFDGEEFEQWCMWLLGKIGFYNIKGTVRSGDQGADILCEKDGIWYAIQCKCYSKDLGNTPIQEVAVAREIYKTHVGAVITNRYFTSGAKQAAAATKVLLWDRDWIKEHLKDSFA